MIGLGRYPSEVKGVADELIELLNGDLRSAALSALSSLGEDGLLNMTGAEEEKALKLLSQTPSQRDKSLGRLDDRTAAILIMRARYLGLSAAKALIFADRFSMVPGMSYRQAAEFGAREIMRASLEPTMDEILPRRIREGW